MTKRNLKMKEFCTIYNICRTKAYEEIKNGRLKIIKCGKSTLIPIESAEKWQESLQQVTN